MLLLLLLILLYLLIKFLLWFSRNLCQACETRFISTRPKHSAGPSQTTPHFYTQTGGTKSDMHQQKRSTYWFSYLVLENLPKGEELGGFLHGHPVTDETCDQAAGQREEEEEDGSEGRSCFNFIHLIFFFPEWQFSDVVLLNLKITNNCTHFSQQGHMIRRTWTGQRWSGTCRLSELKWQMKKTWTVYGSIQKQKQTHYLSNTDFWLSEYRLKKWAHPPPPRHLVLHRYDKQEALITHITQTCQLNSASSM